MFKRCKERKRGKERLQRENLLVWNMSYWFIHILNIRFIYFMTNKYFVRIFRVNQSLISAINFLSQWNNIIFNHDEPTTKCQYFFSRILYLKYKFKKWLNGRFFVCFCNKFCRRFCFWNRIFNVYKIWKNDHTTIFLYSNGKKFIYYVGSFYFVTFNKQSFP